MYNMYIISTFGKPKLEIATEGSCIDTVIYSSEIFPTFWTKNASSECKKQAGLKKIIS